MFVTTLPIDVFKVAKVLVQVINLCCNKEN